jgi:hypothetical protein
MMRGRRLRGVGAALGLTGALLVGMAGTAQAAPESWHVMSKFMRGNVPVYAESVDGWSCWYDRTACASGTRGPGDPAPVFRSPIDDPRANVQVDCGLGAYYKVWFYGYGAEVRSGWVRMSDVRTPSAPTRCWPSDL